MKSMDGIHENVGTQYYIIDSNGKEVLITPVKHILHRLGINILPDLDSNSDANLDNLSGEKLFEIYKVLKEKLGDNQANSFVDLVKNIESFSTTNFLNTLYSLENHNWVNSSGENSIDKKSKFAGFVGYSISEPTSVNATILSSDDDKTEQIRAEFLEMLDLSFKTSCDNLIESNLGK